MFFPAGTKSSILSSNGEQGAREGKRGVGAIASKPFVVRPQTRVAGNEPSPADASLARSATARANFARGHGGLAPVEDSAGERVPRVRVRRWSAFTGVVTVVHPILSLLPLLAAPPLPNSRLHCDPDAAANDIFAH